uniref:Pentraxin family member n=1 Tax=Mola mola TaxID=94237 RepID=A0A3Q3W5C6_MOLML
MAMLFLLAMLTVCAAIPRDLNTKMFTFPQETSTAHVQLTTSHKQLKAVTVCLRSFTDLSRSHSLFSLATPSFANDFLIWKETEEGQLSIYVRNQRVTFIGQNYKVNTWHSICATWDSASGVAQLWLDGMFSSRKFVSSGSNITGPITIILGQEQDSPGGGFSAPQSFLGMMADIHMWDYVISPAEIQNYGYRYVHFQTGNVLSWNMLDFQVTGRVLVEDQQD